MTKRQPSRPELLSARRALARRLAEIDRALDREADLRPFLTDDVCRAALAAIKELARRKRQTVTLDETGAFCVLHADVAALERVLVSALEEAVRGTDEGGELGLSAVVDAMHGVLRFTVWDTSVAHAAADDASRDRLAALDRQIAPLRGQVIVSREPGKGRRVIVIVPANVTTPACSRATLVVAPAPLW